MMMKQRFPNIKLIENKENLGFPKGNNIGVAQAKGEYICILNPDTVVAEDTFEKILNSKLATHNSQLGIIGCKLIDGTGNFLPESKRGIPTPWVAFTKIFGLYKLFPKSSLFNKYYALHLNENQTGKVDILVGAFMVMKRELYNELGGFDENCFMYADDIDLSYRALQNGKSNYYIADSTVIHYKGESTTRDQKYMKHFQEAMQFFYKKHFRKSIVFDWMMQIGSFIFSKIKKNQQHNRVFYADQTVIFSNELLTFPYVSETLTYSKFEELKINPSIKYELVFDIQSFSFYEIINYMNTVRAINITFKMFLPESNFLIGSNNANDKGIIINLSKIE
jgi:GT2 family glycosyltransferase